MRKAVVRYVRPMLTTPLDPTKKGRTLFASHSLYNKGPICLRVSKGDLRGS